jgi:hypothetical protein
LAQQIEVDGGHAIRDIEGERRLAGLSRTNHGDRSLPGQRAFDLKTGSARSYSCIFDKTYLFFELDAGAPPRAPAVLCRLASPAQASGKNAPKSAVWHPFSIFSVFRLRR